MSQWFDEYVAASKAEKAAKAIKEKYRKKTEKLLRRCKKLGIEISGIKYNDCERFSIDDDRLIKWLEENFPEEVLDKVTKKAVNYEAFQNLILDSVIDMSKLPKECYSTTKYVTITVK